MFRFAVTGGLKDLNLIELLDWPLYSALIISIILSMYWVFDVYKSSKYLFKMLLIFLRGFLIIFPLSWAVIYLFYNSFDVNLDELSFFILIIVSSFSIYGILVQPLIERAKYRYSNQKAKLIHNKPFIEKDKIKQLIELEFINKIRFIMVIYFDIILEDFGDKISFSIIECLPKDESLSNDKKSIKLEQSKFFDRFSFKWNNISKKTKISIKIIAEWSKKDNLSEVIKIKPEKCNIELGNGEIISVKGL